MNDYKYTSNVDAADFDLKSCHAMSPTNNTWNLQELSLDVMNLSSITSFHDAMTADFFKPCPTSENKAQ